MANKVLRIVQDKLNRLTTSQLETYGQLLSGQLALVIFDRYYEIVTTTFQPGVITFTSEDYKINKKIFDERQRMVSDKSLMFDIRYVAPPFNYESWERIDLAFEGDYVMYEDEYARITEISQDGTFSIKTTESEEEYTFVVKKSDRDKFPKLVKDLDRKLFSDFLVEINQSLIREAESQPEPEPKVEKTPMESGEHLVEFMDGEVDWIDRSDFCVIGDKVKTSYGDGQITSFDTDLGVVFLKKLDSSMNFHCFANEVIELIGDEQPEEEQPEEQPDGERICKSATLYEQFSKMYDTYLYPFRLFFDENEEIFKHYSTLRTSCYYNMDADNGLGAWCFSDYEYENWMTELDEKMFKYLLLKIKNNPEYFEEKGYQRFYYDKCAELLKLVSITDKVITGQSDDFYYFLYAIGENKFNFYISYENKDESRIFDIEGDRIISAKDKSSIYELTLSNLLKGNWVQKETSETPIYKKMEIFINLVS